MNNTLLPLGIIAIIMATPFTGSASRGFLRADGILAVKGAAATTAKVTIVPFSAPAYTLPVGTRHFELHLPLNDYYLASFTREGCPTKEVYFDASVPVEFTDGEFTFPFKVTLEHMSEDLIFEYEAPVGYVRYIHGLRDFGYETQYIVKVKEELRERMEMMHVTGVDPRVDLPPAALLVVDVPRNGGPAVAKEASTAFEVLAPNVKEVPRLVHRVVRDGDDPTAPSVTAAPEVAASTPAPEAAVEPVVESTAEPIASVPLVEAPSPPLDAPVAKAVPVKPAAAVVQTVNTSAGSVVVPLWQREEETVTGPRMVVRIVRFTRNDGVVEEYRRVAHAYGAVFFFQDRTSITERDFVARTAMR